MSDEPISDGGQQLERPKPKHEIVASKPPEVRPDDVKSSEIMYLNEQTALLNGQIIHRYFHSVWRYKYPPYGYCPFYLKAYNPQTKLFTIVVLDDGRELDSVPLDYPVVPISEEKAQQMVEHRRSGLKTKPMSPSNMELSNRNKTTMSETATPDKPADTKPADDGRTPIRQLALAGFARGCNTKEERAALVAEIKLIYPEKEEKSIKQLVTLYRYNESPAAKAKLEAKKAAAKAAKEPAAA